MRMSSRTRLDQDRSFGLVVGGAAFLVASYLWFRADWAISARIGAIGGAGAMLVALGRFRPRLLRWPSAVWWKVAAVLGWINARIILTIMFVLLLVPIGLIWRAIGRDPLGRRRAAWSGWSPYPARYRDRTHFTRMF